MATAEDRPFYSFGYGPAAVASLQSRTARDHAGFFLPELVPPMTVLDLGCGPGSITIGLAEVVSEGRAVGVDIEPGQIQLAIENAAKRGVQNCTFDVGNVEDLPYEANSFDAVFGHTILLQFRDPSRVLNEVVRVLRPGGVVGFRETDFGAALAFPEDSAHARVFATLRESIIRNDGFPDIGRELPALLSRTGLRIARSSASYHSAITETDRKRRQRWLENTWSVGEFVSRAVSDGWLTQAERDDVAESLSAEKDDPSVFFAMTYCECVARSVV